MINLYESNNKRLKSEETSFKKGNLKFFPYTNNGKTKSSLRPDLIREVTTMPVRIQTENFDVIEKFKALEEKFDGRDDEPIIGSAANEFALEAESHPERYEFLSDWLAEELSKQPQNTRLILDVGSGPGILTQSVAGKMIDCEILGIDISPDMLKIAERNNKLDNVNFVFGDARQAHEITPRPADAAISRRMIHRVDDLEKTLESIARTLKTGGFLLNFSFRKPTNIKDQKSFLEAAERRSDFENLYSAFVKAVLNAPTTEDYERACRNVAHKLNLKDYSIKNYPFDIGIVLIK